MAEEEQDRRAKYQFAAVLSKGMLYCRVTYLDDIEMELKWPYEKHDDIKNLGTYMPSFLESARVHYEGCLIAKDLDKDLDELFKEDDDVE